MLGPADSEIHLIMTTIQIKTMDGVRLAAARALRHGSAP